MRTVDLARETEEKTLHWLKRFGYLTSKQLALLLFEDGRHTSKAAVTRLAQYTLKRLEDGGFLVADKKPCNPAYYAMSLRGCRRIDVPGKYGKDALRHINNHRTLANSIAAYYVFDENKVWTEREIQRKEAPFKVFGRKVPDVLIETFTEQYTDYHWIEIEASKKATRDVNATVDWLRNYAFPPYFNRETQRWEPNCQPISGMGNCRITCVTFMILDKTAANLERRIAARFKELNRAEYFEELRHNVRFWPETYCRKMLELDASELAERYSPPQEQ